MFCVNDEYEADHLVYQVKSSLSKSSGQIIVYGSSVDVYSCIRCIINCGVKGSRIVLARESLGSEEATCLNNPLVCAISSVLK